MGITRDLMKKKKIKLTKTQRGFKTGEFTDRYGVVCLIQKSSLATEDCIWLGASDIGLKVGTPWKDISEKEIKSKFGGQDVIANNRMHLTQQMVKDLLPILQKFVKTGEL